MKLQKLIRHPLTWILLLAAMIRLWRMAAPDVITDEVFYAFRGLGYLDYDVGLIQTSPIQWLDARPWWSWLSFHDHPPMIFLLNFIFLQLGGLSTWVIRLPALLAGLGTIGFTYGIGRLKNRRVAIIATLLLTVSAYHSWISRIGLQESVVIFLLTATAYYYLRWVNDNKKLATWASVLGLGWLTKFTTFILVPIIISHQLLIGQFTLTWKKIVRALAIVCLWFSPVIIYNLALLFRFGHLDFQFSFLLGQKVAEWPTHKGKDLGTMIDKLQLLFHNFFSGENAIIASIFVVCALILCIGIIRQWIRSQQPNSVDVFVGVAIIWTFLLLAVIGGTERFTVLLWPWLAIAAGIVLERWWSKMWFKAVFYLLLLASLLYTVNSFWFSTPLLARSWFVSSLRIYSEEWGYNQLESYLQQELHGKKPSLTFPTRYTWLEELRQKALKGNGESAPILIVYDHRLDQAAALWYLHRRLVYEGWPVIPDTNFLAESKGELEYWQAMGFQTIYSIKGKETLFDPLQTESLDLSLVSTSSQIMIETNSIMSHTNIQRFEITKVQFR